jgi:hypothetical protein
MSQNDGSPMVMFTEWSTVNPRSRTGCRFSHATSATSVSGSTNRNCGFLWICNVISLRVSHPHISTYLNISQHISPHPKTPKNTKQVTWKSRKKSTKILSAHAMSLPGDRRGCNDRMLQRRWSGWAEAAAGPGAAEATRPKGTSHFAAGKICSDKSSIKYSLYYIIPDKLVYHILYMVYLVYLDNHIIVYSILMISIWLTI